MHQKVKYNWQDKSISYNLNKSQIGRNAIPKWKKPPK